MFIKSEFNQNRFDILKKQWIYFYFNSSLPVDQEGHIYVTNYKDDQEGVKEILLHKNSDGWWLFKITECIKY